MDKSVNEVRSDIPFLDTGVIYLDNAATTPTPQPVIDAMLEYFHEYNANVGRGVYRTARQATDEFEKSREKIAKTIGAKPEEIAYTKNDTEAINIVASGLNLGKEDKVVVTILEHHSNLIPWQRLEQTRGVELEIVSKAPNCIVRPSAVEEAIDDRTKLVSMTHLSHAFGTIQPVQEIGKIAKERDVLFLVDSAQAVGHMPIYVDKIGCDFLAAPGHKGLLGPQGTGFLYVREGRQKNLEPLLLGGGIVESVKKHEFKLVDPPQIFDAGTPNIPGIVGLGRAAEYILEIGLEKIHERERNLIRRMYEIDELAPVEVYGPSDPEKIGGALSFNVKGISHHDVSMILDEMSSIATRSGDHCALPSMNYLGIEGTVRASVHFYNTKEEIDKFVKSLTKIAEDSG